MALSDRKSDLLLGYQFNGDSSDTVASYDGTDTDISYASGKFGQCADFNGSSSYISIEQVSEIEGLDQYSIAVWVYPDTDPSYGDHLFRYESGDSYVRLMLTGSRTVEFSINIDGGDSHSITANASLLTTGAWNLVVVTYDQGDLSITINSTTKSSSSVSISTPSGGDGYFGALASSESFYYDGKLDDFWFWGAVLSSSEITELYNSGDGTTWPFGSIDAGSFQSTGTLRADYEPKEITAGHFPSTGSIFGTPYNVDLDYYYTAAAGALRKVYVSPYVGWSLNNSDIDVQYSDNSSFPIAVDKNGNVYGIFYRTDSTYHIHALDSDGNSLWQFSLTSGSADNIAVDPDGTAVWFSKASSIYKLDASDGSEITTGNWPITSAIGGTESVKLLYGRDGSLYSANNDNSWEDIGHVFKIDPSDGSITWDVQIKYNSVDDQSEGYTNYINDIDVNSSGTVAVASVREDYGLDTQIYNSSGTLISWWDIGPQNEAIAIDDDGYVYCGPWNGDTSSYGLQKYDPSNPSSPIWQINQYHPTYLELSHDGNTLYCQIGYLADQPFKAYDLDGTELLQHDLGGNYIGVCQDVGADTDAAWYITVSDDGNGTVYEQDTGAEVEGVFPVALGDSVTFFFTPSAGFLLDDVIVDSASQGTVDSYTFSNVQSSHTLDADFAQGYELDHFSSTGNIKGAYGEGFSIGSFSTQGSIKGSLGGEETAGHFQSTGVLAGSGMATYNEELSEAVGASDSANMAISLSPIEDTLSVWETPKPGWVKSVAESAAITDAATFRLAVLVSEWTAISEAVACNWDGVDEIADGLRVTDAAALVREIAASISETAGVTDSSTASLLVALADYIRSAETVTPGASLGLSLSEAVGLVDTLLAGWMKSLSESVAATDSFILQLAAQLSDSLTGTDTATHGGTFYNALADSAKLTDTTKFAIVELITSVLAATDTAAAQGSISPSVSDSTAISETAAGGLTVSPTVSESLAVAGVLSSQATLYQIVSDSVRLSVLVEIDGETYECFVLSTPHFHSSVYSGFDFNSYCTFEGRAFGANGTGIFELTGTTDNGDTIHTGAVMPETSFGLPQRKRFRKGYLGVTGDSPALIMETEDGERRVYTINDQKNTTISREMIGRRWQLSVTDFDELDFIKLIPVVLARGN